MSIRLGILLGLLLLVVGVAIGMYATPQKVITKTVTEVKTVTIVQHDTQTVITQNPDGSKTTTIVDKSVDTTHEDDKSSTTKVVSNEKPQWKVSAQFAPKNPSIGYLYGVQVDRRILGPVFVGAFSNTDKTLGLNVGLEF